MINIWALEKHESIKLVLILLNEKIGPDNFVIVEDQGLDARAIRLAKPNENDISAYLYTYGQNEERYGVHLELPDLAESDISNTAEIYENLNFSRLADMLCVHFDVVPAMEDVKSLGD